MNRTISTLFPPPPWLPAWVLLPVAAVLSTAPGCTCGSTPGPAASAEEQPSVRPSGSARPRGTGPRREDAKAPAGRRGIGRGLLGATIGEITVTDEQKKALEAALGSLPAAHDRNHANGLAKQLRA